ncbi:hypothetical protein AYI68_g7904 [Smittium mucronatum]|uniref:Uncharacterized protein n=1 Tax=Smittium mucronatum TaxID=133383 RepID=A0A1R0GMD3_9FUNG|nr:hypothetical protein AYI68_g7904 [Smittium mucronatum]
MNFRENFKIGGGPDHYLLARLLVSRGIRLNSAMGIVKRDHELVESGGYQYGFSPELDAWRGTHQILGGLTGYGRACIFSTGTFTKFRSQPPGKVIAYYSYRGGCKKT